MRHNVLHVLAMVVEGLLLVAGVWVIDFEHTIGTAVAIVLAFGLGRSWHLVRLRFVVVAVLSFGHDTLSVLSCACLSVCVLSDTKQPV